MIKHIEELMYLLSDFFLAPVLILIIALFVYSLFALGEFVGMWWQRRRNAEHYDEFTKQHTLAGGQLHGYPLAAVKARQPAISRDELDVEALKQLETVRSVSRLAPMLGLIATMVPMGPALKSLANGNVQGISDNLIVAFSAVIFGLVIASITFWIASVKKRWLAMELVAITHPDVQLKIARKENAREAA